VFADRALRTGFTTSALVSTVMMATLVVGPFYLSHGLGLDAARAGLALSVGPLAAALAGLPAGRLVDRFGAARMVTIGLVAMAAGAGVLGLLPAIHGVVGYLAPIIVVTLGYALFQTANNTAVMAGVGTEQRGVISGLLNLSRSLGLITGASAMGAVFAFATGAADITLADPEAVVAGMRVTLGVAAMLIVAALALAIASRPGP
jgi:MFS family permease